MNAPTRVTLKTAVDNGLIKRPALLPNFIVQNLDNNQSFLVSETANTLLHGAVYPDLLPILNGTLSREEVIEQLADRHSAESVSAALQTLTTKGYLISADYDMDTGSAAFWTSLGASPRFVEETLSGNAIKIYNDNIGLKRALETFGVTLAEQDRDVALTVVVTDDYLNADLAEINACRVEKSTPWLLLNPFGLRPMFGPIFATDENSPCLACLSYRLRGNQEIHDFLRNATDGACEIKPIATVRPSVQSVCGLAATEIVKWLVLETTSILQQHVVSLDVLKMSVAHHRVTRRPQCKVCGSPDLYRPDRDIAPIALEDSPIRVTNSGGLRSVDPETTLKRYRHLVDPISGVITWLRRTTPEENQWLHVHWAGTNMALKNRTLNALRLSLRTKSAGKGSTRIQSEASALCEAIERYSGAYHDDEIRVKKRYCEFGEVAGRFQAIKPTEIQLFSETQLLNASTINSRGDPYNVVPPRFDPEAEIDWSPVWSLTHNCPRYLPTALLYYGKTVRNFCDAQLVADSNGCAAGNTFEEAILQGLLELVERDAFAVWWYNRLRVPKVDFESFADPYLEKAQAYYRSLNRELWVLDLTHDLKIPTFVALSRRFDKSEEDIIYGSGAHFDARVAILRAICELNQFLNWVQAAEPGGAGYAVTDPQCLTWWKTATVENQPYLKAADGSIHDSDSYPILEVENIKNLLVRFQETLENKNLELLVLNQTRPDINMPVVRVIVPGMRHYWPRFAAGRLYDVPVGRGQISSPLSEEELNTQAVIG